MPLVVVQIALEPGSVCLRDQLFRLPRQARHVCDAQFWRFNAVTISTRASSHEAFARARMHGLEADVAFQALRVGRARLDRDRDGLLVFFVGVVLFRVAAAVDFLTHLLVAAAPVVVLASLVAVSRVASNASRRGVSQWGGAGGAFCEDHLAFLRWAMFARRLIGLKNPIFSTHENAIDYNNNHKLV